MAKQLKSVVKLPESELAVMQLIWEMHRAGEPAANITAGNLMERFPDKIGHLKLTTVLTLISRLIGKKFIRAEKAGRSYCYIPLVGEEEYKQMAAQDFVKTVFKNDTRGLISALVTGENLTENDID
jgi:BlaI family penicillinase repressor